MCCWLVCQWVQSFGLWHHQYADGTQVSLSPFHLNLRKLFQFWISVLCQCLVSVIDEMRAIKLKLNPDKTEVLLLSRNVDQGIGMQPVLDRITLPLKTQLRSLADSPGIVTEPGCQGFSAGQECICTINTVNY